jgi:geranylgeranyl diphosphate synthase, type II
MSNSQLQDLQEKISAHIAKMGLDKSPGGLYEPVAYCLKNGGKRMRPVMTLLGCQLFGGDVEKAVPPALGLELFHNFTLMHDDIMDNAPLRRSQPTVHTKWGANAAILSGDVMFALAYKQMLEVPDQVLRKIMELFNQTVIEVCEGQQYDMDFESMDHVSEADYLEMIRLKTAVLPAACLQTGAIIAGASDEDAKKLYRFGECVGLSFQLRDDWLDVYGEEAVFGKKSGGDIIANKKTWLTIKAFELAGPGQKELLEKAFSGGIPDPQQKVKQVTGVYNGLGIQELAVQKMEGYYRIAFEHLDGIAVAPEHKEGVATLAKNLLDRRH